MVMQCCRFSILPFQNEHGFSSAEFFCKIIIQFISVIILRLSPDICLLCKAEFGRFLSAKVSERSEIVHQKFFRHLHPVKQLRHPAKIHTPRDPNTAGGGSRRELLSVEVSDIRIRIAQKICHFSCSLNDDATFNLDRTPTENTISD